MGIKVKFNHWWLWKKFCLANCKEGQEQERQKKWSDLFLRQRSKNHVGYAVCLRDRRDCYAIDLQKTMQYKMPFIFYWVKKET